MVLQHQTQQSEQHIPLHGIFYFEYHQSVRITFSEIKTKKLIGIFELHTCTITCITMVQRLTYPLSYWGGYLHFSAWCMEHLSIILTETGLIMK